MKNLLFTIVSLLIFISPAVAQELPLFTQYREFQSFINPGAVPVDYLSQDYQPTQTLGVSYRNQWKNFDGGPTTFTARYEYFAEDFNSTFGGNFINDKTGRYSRVGGFLRYAYKLEFSRATALTIGAKFGAFQNRYDSKDGILVDPGDLIGETNVNQFTADFGFGVFLTQEVFRDDIFYAGLSIPQFSNGSGGSKEDFLHESTHVYLNAGMYKKLGTQSNLGFRTMYIEPSIWLKYATAAPIQTDFNFRVHLPDLLWIGLGYGVGFEDKLRGNFLHFEGGFVFDEAMGLSDQNLKIGFGYDNIFSNASFGGFGSSFEINLSFSWL